MPPYGAHRFTRVAGPTPNAPDVYSPIQEGWVSPGKFQNSDRPIWRPLPIKEGAQYAKAATYGEETVRCWRGTIPRYWCLTANSRPSPSTRCPSNRSRPRLVRPRPQKPRTRAGCPVAVRNRNGNRIPVRRGRWRVQPASINAQFAYIAAASAARITRRFRSMSLWRRCFSPAARSGSRTTATSSSRAA